MQVLLAVIDDLFQFAKTSLFGVVISSRRKYMGNQTAMVGPTPSGGTPVTQSLRLFGKNESDYTELVKGQHYFIGEPDAYLYNDPTFGFDTALAAVSYGTKVALLKFGGRWAQVRCNGYEGWILKDVLRDTVRDVFPEFVTNTMYGSEHEVTIQVRAYIEDEFKAAQAGLCLTAAEYVVHALKRTNRSINWSKERPRIPGTWQRKLRGRTNVHIGVLPKKEAIMEYVVDDIGYVAYVEAVFPDESIQISGVGLYEEGVYSEEVLPKEQYRELQPVFIEIT